MAPVLTVYGAMFLSLFLCAYGLLASSVESEWEMVKTLVLFPLSRPALVAPVLAMCVAGVVLRRAYLGVVLGCLGLAAWIAIGFDASLALVV